MPLSLKVTQNGRRLDKRYAFSYSDSTQLATLARIVDVAVVAIRNYRPFAPFPVFMVCQRVGCISEMGVKTMRPAKKARDVDY